MTAFPAPTWTRPPRRRTGVLGLGVLALVASTWLLVPRTLVLWDAIVGGIGGGEVIERGASAAVTATLVLVVGAVASRSAWLLVLAIPVLAVHGLVLIVVAIVAGASGISGLAVLSHLGDAAAMLIGLVAVVLALVATAAARAGDRREGAAWYAGLVLVGIASIVVAAAPYLVATRQGMLPTFVTDTVAVVALVAVALLAGLRSAAARWTAAALATLTAIWLVLLDTVVLPAAFAGTLPPVLSAAIAIAAVRAALLVLAATLVALSTRWLATSHATTSHPAPSHALRTADATIASPLASHAPDGSRSTLAPDAPRDADAAIDQSDREVPTDAPGPLVEPPVGHVGQDPPTSDPVARP